MTEAEIQAEVDRRIDKACEKCQWKVCPGPLDCGMAGYFDHQVRKEAEGVEDEDFGNWRRW